MRQNSKITFWNLHQVSLIDLPQRHYQLLRHFTRQKSFQTGSKLRLHTISTIQPQTHLPGIASDQIQRLQKFRGKLFDHFMVVEISVWIHQPIHNLWVLNFPIQLILDPRKYFKKYLQLFLSVHHGNNHVISNQQFPQKSTNQISLNLLHLQMTHIILFEIEAQRVDVKIFIKLEFVGFLDRVNFLFAQKIRANHFSIFLISCNANWQGNFFVLSNSLCE